MLPVKTYTFVVPASGVYLLPVIGSYFVILAATGTVEVSADTFGTIGNMDPGHGIDDADFRQLQFLDKSGAANTIKVLIGGDKFVNQRVLGEVSVIDGSKMRSISGQALTAEVNVPGSPANFTHIALLNSSVTKRVVVQRVTVQGAAADNIYLRTQVGGLSTNAGATVKAKMPGFVLSGVGGGFTYQYAAASIPNGTTAGILQHTAGGVNSWVAQADPIVLTFNQALVAYVSNNLNTDMNTVWEWFEEAI